jgi:hypothetical protein
MNLSTVRDLGISELPVLPKLAVTSWPWSVLGPHGIGTRWSGGHQRS